MKNKTVIPGLHDSHLHNVKYGYYKSCCDLSGCTSLDQLIDKMKQYISENRKAEGTWVVGRGWNQDLFDVKAFPQRADLDRISKEHPILLHRCCAHVAVVNSAALSALKIDESSLQVDGGEFDVTTGVFKEKAKQLAEAGIPPHTAADFKDYIKAACESLLQQGITSIQSDDFSMTEAPELIIQAYSELAAAGELPVRVTQQCQMRDIKWLNRFIEKT